MIRKKEVKLILYDSINLFRKKEGYRMENDPRIDMVIDFMFDDLVESLNNLPNLFEKSVEKYSLKKNLRLYKITDDFIVCLIVKCDYFSNSIHGHLKVYNNNTMVKYIKSKDIFYNTGYRSKKEISVLKSYYDENERSL